MEQILSQEEIDALLKGISEGEIETPPEVPVEEQEEIEAESFDYIRYTRGKKERLPSLDFIYDRFSKSFRQALSLFVEKEVEVGFAPISYLEYGEFIKTLPLPTNMNIVVTEGLNGFFIMTFDAKLIFSVLETIFGSSGVSKQRVEGREFTKIEFNVIRKLIDLASVEMEKAWSPVYEITCRYSRSEINPNYITMVSKEETVSLCEFTIEIGDIKGWMKVCVPYGILETIKSFLISTPSREDTEMREKWLTALKERIREVPLDVRAILGRKKMALQDFLNMEDGSVIVIDKYVDDPVEVEIENKNRIRGRLGIYKGNKAIKVEELVS
ncbi:flagellar motor switch protein FliM [Syntrophorhabdus aromaticivorans]|uniref:Flagellar motor switch protein FliM n=1 Tax=Syntrophorhabdus aromaticivorans TaxID=328301 RepID=A0A971M5K8_9BACT|nr:flagellar motor switch protein FliM [Syntrophorhabdus aromaticivorans]NLW36342.1 flagellar motor switch protein FliM [Syntrophorhabdus aromaticivorans]